MYSRSFKFLAVFILLLFAAGQAAALVCPQNQAHPCCKQVKDTDQCPIISAQGAPRSLNIQSYEIVPFFAFVVLSDNLDNGPTLTDLFLINIVSPPLISFNYSRLLHPAIAPPLA
ncbi:MAG: hypothetical protein ABIB65_03120 [Candidatus Margulisiibacteriota bacterium]